MKFDFDVSIIIPVYNVEEFLRKCLDSLVAQKINKEKIEVLLVDDGSTDSSPAICDEFAAAHSFFKVFHRENGGVSAARNFGIENARGKYLLFLDSDDWLTPKSVSSIVSFFNAHYDEIDVVTYNEMNDWNGDLKPSAHFRYNYINKTGIYDLTDPDYKYFVQCHMNICVKNRGKDNFKFDTTMIFHEDQKYILSNLAFKHKIGYCDKATYVYVRNSGGATQMRSHPYYIFEKTMELWESFFRDDNVPKYVQSFFFHDFTWKLKADLLWPYQYKGEKFRDSCDRIINILKKVDDDVIHDFPGAVNAHKVYVYKLKYGEKASIKLLDNSYEVVNGDEMLMKFEDIELYLTKFHVRNGKLTMIGVIKCLAANFTDNIKAFASFADQNGNTKETELKLKYSSLSLCASKTLTSNFKMFVIKCPVSDLSKIDISAEVEGRKYPVRVVYAPTSPFNKDLKRNSYICEGINIKCSCKKGTACFSFKKAGILSKARVFLKNIRFSHKIGYRNTLTRLYSPIYRKKHRIWFYIDSAKTVKDNAYYQFIHDIKKTDGIERYYIYNPDADISGWFDASMNEHLIPYGSLKHRLYALSAEKCITSFYGLRDMLSYPYGAMKYFYDLVNFDIIYLQHGVLHANLPTMYSLDRMILDKEVISTHFEEQNMTENYCFDDSFFIKSGMPRYDHIDVTRTAEKKILFAPSWRKFLVDSDKKGGWLPKEKAFLASDFYKVTAAFLSDPRLVKVLKDNGYVLDFKLHPNFRCYDHLYNVDGETVRIAEKTVDEFSYSVFITDFSSFVFDFIYLKRPILYFVPDKDLFDAGLNHYRKLDIPLEDGFGELSTTCDKAVNDLIALIENNCVPEKKYVDKMNGLFFDVENHAEELYQSLMSE